MSKGRRSRDRFVQRAMGKDESAEPRRDTKGRVVAPGFPVYRFSDVRIWIDAVEIECASTEDITITLPEPYPDIAAKREDDQP